MTNLLLYQRIAQQLAEGKARQHGQAEQQQTDPEGRRSSQGTPARWAYGMQMDGNIIALAGSI